ELATVVDNLKDAGLDVDYGRYSAEANQLDQPGQAVEIDDHDLFVFLYPAGDGEQAVADREADAADLDTDTLELTSRRAERPLNEGEDVHVFQQSNVVAVLVGGDDDLVQSVGDVIESLP